MTDRHHHAYSGVGDADARSWSSQRPYSQAALPLPTPPPPPPPPPPLPTAAMNRARGSMDSVQRYGDVKYEIGSRSSFSQQSDSGADEGSSSLNARKRRIHYSCDECHRRKQKCNRQLPCQHCCTRGIPHLCKFSATQEAQQQQTASHVAALAERSPLATNATNLDNNKSSLLSSGTGISHAPSSELHELKSIMQDGLSQILQAVRQTPRIQSEQSSSALAHASPSIPSVLGKRKADEDKPDDEDDLYINPSSLVSTSRGSKLLDMLSINNAANTFDPTRNIDARTSIDNVLVEMSSRDIRGTGPMSQGLLACLPSPEQTDRLFNAFMEDHESVRYPLSAASLRRCMAMLPAIRQRGQIAADELTSYSVITATLSHAALKMDDEEAPAHEMASMHRNARALIFASIKALCTSDIIGQMDLAKCLGHHLASRFLVMDRRLNEAFMCAGAGVRCAQGLGLHRIDPNARNQPDWQIEEERLLWCALRSDERSNSILTERPSSIDDRICHTTPPSPSSTLSAEDAAFVRYRHDLATLQGRMILLLQQNHSAKGISIKEILALDEELEAFRGLLPSDDLRRSENPSQRFSIHSHVLQTRLALLRPFFLRSIPKNASIQTRTSYGNCRRACVEAACKDVALREMLVRNVGALFAQQRVPGYIRRSIRTPRWFTSLIICGAYLLIGNQESNANSEERTLTQRARHHLHTFVELAEDRQRREGQRDAALDREVGIIRMFLQKSSEKAVARFKSEGKRHRTNESSANGEENSQHALGWGHRRPMGSDSTIHRSSASDAHSTPSSMTSPSGSGTYVGAESHDRTRCSSAQSGEELQAVLDAWFQSDTNISGSDGVQMPFMFQGDLGKFGNGNSGSTIIQAHSNASDPSSIRVPSINASLQQPQIGSVMHQHSSIVGPGGFSAGFNIHDKVGMSAQTGEFWQGFINMLSSQSNHVHY